jgi:hypothetical protein
VVQVVLRCAGRGLVLVGPAGQRRHRQQDRLGAPARLQAEVGAAVPDQVELDITPAPVELEVALALAVGQGAPALDDRQVGAQEGVTHRTQHRKTALGAQLGEVVEEDAPPHRAVRCGA